MNNYAIISSLWRIHHVGYRELVVSIAIEIADCRCQDIIDWLNCISRVRQPPAELEVVTSKIAFKPVVGLTSYFKTDGLMPLLYIQHCYVGHVALV